MTQQEILDYNRRCAEFLGCVEHSYPSSMGTPFHGRRVWMSPTSSDGKTRTFYCVVGEEHFHDDWNWIMEVVEAIEKLPKHFTTSIHSDAFDKGDEYKMFIFNNEGEILVGENGKTKKEAVVNTINQFLIWYNENKS